VDGVRQARLFQKNCDLVAVGCRPIMQVNHAGCFL
jgi:hypothetical protein